MSESARSAASPSDRRELLKQLLAEAGRGNPDARRPAIRPDIEHRHEPYPLSDVQRAYWLGRDPAFPLGGVGIHGYFEIDCRDLDVARLDQAWNETIRRHDMMRVVVDRQGQARILEQVPRYTIEYEDLRNVAESEREHRLAELRRRMSHQVFDVSHWPLFEIRAIRLDDRRTRLLVSEDAIHLDLRSSELVARDWIALYNDERPPPPPEISFRDFALAHAEAPAPRHGPGTEERLARLPDPPALPRAAGDAEIRMLFNRRGLCLEAAAWSAFRGHAARHDLTPSDALLAAYADVLGAWSASPRFVLNVTVQNRPPIHPDVGRVTGDFTDFVLVAIDLQPSGRFVDRARRHRDALWRALDEEEISGVELLRRVSAIRGGDHPFVAPFVYTSALGTSGYRAIGALGEIVHEVTQTPQVLLDQQVLEVDGALHLSWDMVEGAFPAGMAEAMFATLEARLRALAVEPEAWESETPVPLPPDQMAARARMNDTAAPVREIRLEAMFEAAAAARPEATALIDQAGALSFQELSAQSDRLAAAIAAGVPGEPDAPVAVCVPKGRDQVIAVLAILKAGRPYLAIDPATPDARLAAALGVAGCAAAVVPPEGPVAPALDAVTHIPADADAGHGRHHGPAAPSALAYVLFTSGSTGEPKGVPITHRSVVNRMDDVIARFGLGPGDRAIALTALHHDLSVFDLFGVLADAGGAVILPPADEGPGNPARWADLIATHEVTVWNSAPAFLEMLLASEGAEPSGRLRSLRKVFLSGDWVPRHLPGALARHAPEARTVALGGPTETTVWDICYPVESLPEDWPSVPYGRPMLNARYHVRRDDGGDCPDWVTGELWIEGEGLSPGYIGGSEADRARFTRDPVSGAAVYRSGDLGRVRPGGLIEFIGRKDRMAKLRGQRIELGDVEAAMRSLPGVARAVAFTVTGPGGQPALAAALTPAAVEADDDTLPADELALPPPATIPWRPDERRSALSFSSHPVEAERLARMLAHFRAVIREESGELRRHYPSAGAKYAVEVLLHVRAGGVARLAGGLYALQPEAGRLVRLGGPGELPAACHAERNRSLAAEAAATLILAARADTLRADYPDNWRDLALLEAGYMGQLATQAATANGLGICPLGWFKPAPDVPVPAGLQVMHALLLGGIPGPASAARGWRPGSEARLREDLAALLPRHMMPSTLILAESLPLTRNGKPDAAALARLADARMAGNGEAHAPAARDGQSNAAAEATDLQGALRDALTSVIGSAEIPLDRSFQELGVFSVELVRLHAKLRDAGFSVELADLFTTPSVAALAARLSGEEPAGDAAAERARRRRANLAARRRATHE